CVASYRLTSDRDCPMNPLRPFRRLARWLSARRTWDWLLGNRPRLTSGRPRLVRMRLEILEEIEAPNNLLGMLAPFSGEINPALSEMSWLVGEAALTRPISTEDASSAAGPSDWTDPPKQSGTHSTLLPTPAAPANVMFDYYGRPVNDTGIVAPETWDDVDLPVIPQDEIGLPANAPTTGSSSGGGASAGASSSSSPFVNSSQQSATYSGDTTSV